MSKPDSYPVPESIPHNEKKNRFNGSRQQEPLSGSKKTKQRNHVSHLNREG
ncbi:small acid-soluble spore protein P [Paenibacillus alkaliterrae]|uniref:small acid-soluble spore protein P n=1 Tax=Paenibacillus alkaliterrae TaxID=320909 RepID=UPI001F1ADB6D|nr:small acid-soluble spore protein P [Paenibacillus alkaliterrae]MCF2941184.1 small acid-soluble spore protein P [Paenibacillus alkaliterrae]